MISGRTLAVYNGNNHGKSQYEMNFVLTLAVIISVVNGQCSTTDHPNCASWVKNGFCTNPGYTKAYIQQYCPKACPMSNCICPVGWNNTGPAVNTLCATGYCPKTCKNCGCTCSSGTTFVANTVSNKCASGTLFGSVCCIDYSTPSMIVLKSAVLVPIGYVMVVVPGRPAEGQCVDLSKL
ncbi:hypothetical protein PRIPAC_71141 [Pristionchus pacificus]|uniref:ShK domain-containing protein n=1 Tax=Pristionchus pacificus TaxID=54126 RepID=A0A2A6C014_PRIPA|nr:hypothetical protein PRIPAC_71141 [Pristionchus pacificus]|eukprot:PDM71592.1 ShK domain-containing protein [Pristionchus pacificus]